MTDEMTPAIWLNILFLLIALGVAFVYLKREHLRQKANEDWLKTFTRYTKTVDYKQRNSYAAQYREIADPIDAFPRLERDGFKFVDLARAAITVPPDIALPPLRVKRRILPDDYVLLQVVWKDETTDCNVWVQITATLPDDLFTGKIIAAASNAGEGIIGQKVAFSANHIAVIERPSLRPSPN